MFAHTFDSLPGVAMKHLREMAVCYGQDGTVILSAALYEGQRGAWELVVRQFDGPGQAVTHHDDAAEARRAIESVYTTGRRHGQWRVERKAPIINLVVTAEDQAS